MSSRLLPLKVAGVRRISDRGLAISFDTGLCDEKFRRFRAGQYIALEADIDGQAVRRCYSVASSPRSGKLEVGIRVLADGKFSSWADEHLKPGDELRALTPEGKFLLPSDKDEFEHLLFIACGSGITPTLAMIDEVLAGSDNARITLIYGNSTIATMMFREEILFLKNRYPDRLQTVFMFSRQEQDVALLNGRVSKGSLIKIKESGIVNFDSFDHSYICGPRPVIEQAEEFLRENGMADERIHHELFLSADGKDVSTSKMTPTDSPAPVAEASARIKVDGRWYTVALQGDASVLDQAMDQGVDLPYSCLAGVCSSCRARLVKGKVSMDVCDALEEVDKHQGYILTCQAKAQSEELEIDFDQ